MAKRIILGSRSGVEGLWISKPTKSADSTSPGDFLIDTSKENSYAFMKGSFNAIPFQTSGAVFIGNDPNPPHDPTFIYYYDYNLTITHGLGYVPFMWSMVAFDGTPGPVQVFTSPTFQLNNTIFLTSSALIAQGRIYYNGTPQQTPPPNYALGGTINYVIFQNRLGA